MHSDKQSSGFSHQQGIGASVCCHLRLALVRILYCTLCRTQQAASQSRAAGNALPWGLWPLPSALSTGAL